MTIADRRPVHGIPWCAGCPVLFLHKTGSEQRVSGKAPAPAAAGGGGSGERQSEGGNTYQVGQAEATQWLRHFCCTPSMCRLPALFAILHLWPMMLLMPPCFACCAVLCCAQNEEQASAAIRIMLDALRAEPDIASVALLTPYNGQARLHEPLEGASRMDF